jgi:transposase
MRCARCGATAMVTRGQEYLCGRCALTRDWEEIIAIAQEALIPQAARTERPPQSVGAGASSP